METVTTAVYTVIGPSPITGFVVFALFSFWGGYLFYRAFCIGLPGGDRRRYAVLVFLLPSLLFWPSSIGKEAWLYFFLGLSAYGVARFFRHGAQGLVPVALGIVGTMVVRPHIAVLVVVALVAAQIARPSSPSPTAMLTKVMGVAAMVATAVVLAGQSAEFLELEEVTWEGLASEIEERSDLASQGGSEFESTPVTSPFQLPAAALTVMFRPFPYEASNVQLLVQSLEGLMLLVLLVGARHRLRALPRLMRTTPFLTFAVVYVLGFVWAFSGIGNFGILARQRVLMLPLLLVVLALPAIIEVRKKRPGTPRGATRSAASVR